MPPACSPCSTRLTRLAVHALAALLFVAGCSSGSDAPAVVLGDWQCMTRQQQADEPMFTFRVAEGGRWTDLTFGPARRQDADYAWAADAGELRLRSAAGNALYSFTHAPAAGTEKERLVEVLPDEELYRAQVCYRYDGPLAD